MIIKIVVSHSLYALQKKTNNLSYSALEAEWEKFFFSKQSAIDRVVDASNKTGFNSKLSISSICLITNLPKETVRRKIIELNNKNILKSTKTLGVVIDKHYKEIFQEFVPTTVVNVSKLLKKWDKEGVLKYLLNFQVDE